MIVLPSIGLLNGCCVQLRQGDPATETVHDDDPVLAARRWVEQGAEWLMIGTAAIENPVLAEQALGSWGPDWSPVMLLLNDRLNSGFS